MKYLFNLFVLMCFLYFIVQLQAESTNEWVKVKIDSLVTVDYPSSPEISDSTFNGSKCSDYFLVQGSSMYLVKRIELIGEKNPEARRYLPSNQSELTNIYDNLSIKLLKLHDAKLKFLVPVHKDSLEGRRYQLINKKEEQVGTGMMFYFNENLYLIDYFNDKDYDNDDMNTFLSSLNISNEHDIVQIIRKEDPAERLTNLIFRFIRWIAYLFIALLVIVGVIAALRVRIK